MKVVIQRSKKSAVLFNNQKNEIDFGIVVLVGFTEGDDEKTIDYIVNKILNLRIFDDQDGVMNKSLIDINGSILSIPQFTLYADTEKGRRPSYIKALDPKKATKLYDLFNQKIKENNINLKQGLFGAEMEVKITNDGPVTIIIER